jgi:hypothetical protein
MSKPFTRLIIAALALYAGASRATAASSASCSVDSSTGVVTCTLPSSASSIDLKAVVTDAHALNEHIDATSPIIITAFGGAGAKGNDNSSKSGGGAGAGGSARMVTTLVDFLEAHDTPMLYYYLGAQGADNHPGGKGGSATIISIADLSSTAATTTNVLLIGGGGGGGGSAEPLYSGHGGGSGGKASSEIDAAATVSGASGGSGNGSGGGGAGGSSGSGGSGGSGGDGIDAKAGTSGDDGLGGQGGPVHISDGPSTSTGWLNVTDVPSGIGTNGKGGEGEVRCSGCGEGGGGGGGYGGGGGGGGGGDTFAGGGGGGGGSYAAASTAYSTTTASNSGDDGSVVILLEEVCTGTEGRGETIAQDLLDDFIAPFNKAWPLIAKDEKLDPFNDVYDGKVDLGCGPDHVADTLCAALTDGIYPVCSEVYAEVDVSQIDGLSNLEITSLTLETANELIGTSCPYDSNAVDDTSFRCSISGTSTADVKLTAQAKAVVSSIKLKVKCSDPILGDVTDDLWTGNATCTSSGGTASAEVDYCGGVCSRDSGLSSLVALEASDLKMKLTNIDCDITTTDIIYAPIEPYLDEILSDTADLLGSTIESALAPSVTSALNDVVKEVLPLPDDCSAQ